MKQIVLFSIVMILSTAFTSCGNKSKDTVGPVKVKTMIIAPSTQKNLSASSDGIIYSGTLEESTGTSVSFATAGTVRSVLVENGQTVSKGQLIATLDQTSLKSAHDITMSLLNQAKDAYDRMKQLYNTKSISEMQWVEVQSKLEQAESSEQMARKAMEDARLVAPCSGVITKKTLEPGQNVLPSAMVMNIVDINKVKVNISVPENEVSGITNGQTVHITVPAVGSQVYTGRITEKDVTANTLTRTYHVKATLDNPGRILMPGMICNVVITGGKVANNVTLPLDAVQLSDKNFYYVWTVQNGQALKKFINVGAVTADGVIVESGLTEGDKVIVEGQQKVSENMKVSEK